MFPAKAFRNTLGLALQEKHGGKSRSRFVETRAVVNIIVVVGRDCCYTGEPGEVLSAGTIFAATLEAFARGDWNDLSNANRLCDEQRLPRSRKNKRAFTALALTRRYGIIGKRN